MKKVKKIFSAFREKLTIKSARLILLISFYFTFVLNLSFWRYIWVHLPVTNLKLGLFAFTFVCIIFILYHLIFSLLFIPKIGKPMTAFFLVVSASTNYLMWKYGLYIDVVMVRNLFETTAREASDFFTLSGIFWVVLMGIVPAVLLLMTKVIYDAPKKEIRRRLVIGAVSIVLVVAFLGISFKQYASFGRNNRQIRQLLNSVNYTYSTIKYIKAKCTANRIFKKLDENARLAPYEDPYKTVVILVVGEAARAKNFSLNGYHRKTNPRLEKEDIIYYANVTSCGTSTAVSIPCMFSHLDRKDVDADDVKYMDNLMDIIQRGGYEVIWLENDDGCKGACNRVPTEHMLYLKDPKYCGEGFCRDDIMIDGLEERLKKIKRNTVIVLHTMGSHGPAYYQRYTDAYRVFEPTCDTADIQSCSKESIQNTYDNTILYTDHIIASVIDILKKFPNFESGMMYLSDHGESLGEGGIYLHGLPYAIAPDEQTDIPMIVWMSENMKKYDYLDYDCLKKQAAENAYSHDNFFHSMIGWLEIKSELYKKDKDIFSTCRTKEPPAEKEE